MSKILVVDDTADGRLLLKALLEDEFDISEASSGAECLELIEQDMPDLILLDVNMPGMSGYEVCTTLRKQPHTENLPIIFVSGLDGTEERLAGYEAGANDYVIKPVVHEQLSKKVRAELQRYNENRAAKDDASNAMQIAMEAMTVSSELGQIVQFVKDISAAATPIDVGHAIINIANEFGLSVSLRIRTDVSTYVGCEADSIEAKLLERFANHPDRIFSLGIRTIIRSKHAEMLIKNMPMDDENRYGRLKDHIAVLMDIANSQLKTLEAQSIAANQRTTFLKEIIAIAEEQLELTSKRIEAHNLKSQNIMQQMLTDLEAMLFGLGLEDDQENRLMQLADQTSSRLQASKSSTQELSSDLGLILDSLYKLLKK